MGAVRMRVQTADKNITIIHTSPSVKHLEKTKAENNPSRRFIVDCILTGRYGLLRVKLITHLMMDLFVQTRTFCLLKTKLEGLEWCELL